LCSIEPHPDSSTEAAVHYYNILCLCKVVDL
jgi:hypothetical protein